MVFADVKRIWGDIICQNSIDMMKKIDGMRSEMNDMS